VWLCAGGFNSQSVLRDAIHSRSFGLHAGFEQMHSPSLLITVNDLPSAVVDALKLATAQAATNTSLVQIPHSSFNHSLWMATVPPASLTCKISSLCSHN
jgi:hypothetical protein